MVLVEHVGVGVTVRCDVAVESPCVSGHVLEEPLTGAGRDTVDGVVWMEKTDREIHETIRQYGRDCVTQRVDR